MSAPSSSPANLDELKAYLYGEFRTAAAEQEDNIKYGTYHGKNPAAQNRAAMAQIALSIVEIEREQRLQREAEEVRQGLKLPGK